MEPVLIVCGSRKWIGNEARWILTNELDSQWKRGMSEIWEGGAFGADLMGYDWAKKRGITVRVWPADWQRFGKSAGFKRSAEMTAAAPEGSIVVAFVKGLLAESRGTLFTVNQAHKKGLRVWIVYQKTDDAEYSVSHPAPSDGELRPHPTASPSLCAGCE